MPNNWDNPENPTNSFERYLLLPPENRMHIVDSMRPGDRVRFTRCSTLSRAEAMRSKFYMYGLEFSGVDVNDIRIHVLYGDDEEEVSEDDEEERDVFGYGFILEFKVENGTKYVVYSDLGWNELWRDELCPSMNLVQLANEQFKRILHIGQNKIKKLIIHHWPFFRNQLHDFDFQVARLPQLEVLEIKFNSNINQFISKLRHPLKKLSVYEERNNQALANYEWSSVQEYIFAPFIRLNYEKFLQLKASRVTLHLGDMTERDIFNYIKLWKSGQIGKEVECYKWGLEGAEFDIQKIVTLLGGSRSENEGKVKLFIDHDLEKSRRAVLFFAYRILTFDTDPTSQWDDTTSEEESDEEEMEEDDE